jgi:hypothetical protein
MALNQAEKRSKDIKIFEKGGFRGISMSYLKSPLPPFDKEGLKNHGL